MPLLQKLYYIFAVVTLAGGVIYTGHKIITYVYFSGRFIRELASNHLPHIYARLGRIDNKLGLEKLEPPDLRHLQDDGIIRRKDA